MTRNNRIPKTKGYIDYTLIFIILLLLGFGLIMVYSTSSYEASMSQALHNNAAYYLNKQAFATIFGLGAMFVVALLPYHIWEKVAAIGYGVSVVLILLVLTPLGMEINGARRWLNLGISLQPAEISKLAMIIFLASLVVRLGGKISTRRGFLTVLAVPLPICFLVWVVTQNLSSAIIIFSIGFIMLFVASPDYKKFILLALGGIILAALAVFVVVQLSHTSFFGYRGQRIRTWLDPEAYASDTGFQTLQALYAIGSGGLFGKGLGQSTQKLGFVPEAQNDMIFSIICEELGLFGGICIIVLFLLMLWRLMLIAVNAPDQFGGLLVAGVMGHIAVQVILNVAVVTNTIPNTGISLPFISYGGSSVMFLLIEMGLVFSVSRSITFIGA